MRIDIVVPTYNCGRWIDEFIESLLKQDYDTWRIITRDDGSTDDTVQRIFAWSQRLGDRMTIVSNPEKLNYGSVGNYDIVLGASTAQWIMLADGDDIWKPGKISLTLKAMLEAENRVGSNKPVVVFTDAEVVDERGRPLAESYWKWARLRPELSVIFNRMIVESAALGATMMINRTALNLALPVIGSTFHDWWLALVACAFGNILHLNEKTIAYRRHSSNVTEVPLTASAIGVIRNVFIARQRVKKLLRELAPQAATFVTRFRSQLSSSDVAALEAAARLPSSNFAVRRWIVIRHDLWFSSLIKNIGMMIFL